MADWPYNSTQWKRLRAIKLASDPMCGPCLAAGRLTRANTVDHVVPISAGGPAFPGLDGLASMCGPCHSAKTARGSEAGAARTTRALRPRRGCDANGNPLDPAHPWSIPRGNAAPESARLGGENMPQRHKSLGAECLETAPGVPNQLVSPNSCLGGINNVTAPGHSASKYPAGINRTRKGRG